MPRRNSPPKRVIPSDLKYGSDKVQRLINRVMMSGKKSVAQRVVYSMMEAVEEDEYDADGGGRGYCTKFEFICHNLRVCQAWEEKEFEED